MSHGLLARAIMFLSVVSGAGSLALFVGFPLGSLRIVRPLWPEWGALCWDGFLCLAFFLQHSGMVRRGFGDRLSGIVPRRYHRAVYCIASGVALTGLVVLWQPSGTHLLALRGPLRWAAHAGALLAISVFIWGALVLRDLDLFGLAPIKAHLGGTMETASPFVVRGPYRWVRHPWYSAAIVLFWSYPDLTADRLLFDALWTAWVCVGTWLEEKDLLDTFGDVYGEYRRRVPMLIPWRVPAAL